MPGADPDHFDHWAHDDPKNQVDIRKKKISFLLTYELIDDGADF